MVRGNHMDDLVAERMAVEKQKMIDSGQLRSGDSPAQAGASAPDGLSFNIEDLPPERQKLMAETGLNTETLKTLLLATECKRKGIGLKQAMDEWFEKAKKGDVVLERINARIIS